MSRTEQTIIITGDITMDWNLARTRRSPGDTSFWNADDTVRTTWQRGGAALLADLVEAIARDLPREEGAVFSIRQTGAPRASNQVQPNDDRNNHSYAMWSQFKYGDKPAWRVEEFLGLNRCSTACAQDWQKVVGDTAAADLVILDDANLGFRENADFWPAALHSEGDERPWILLKMAGHWPRARCGSICTSISRIA